MARWSRMLNREFVPWLEVPSGASWLDVGCGTGALSRTLFEIASPGSVTGVDPSPQFVEAARAQVPEARFVVGGAERLPFEDESFDAAAAALCFHIMPDPVSGAAEIYRVLRRGGAAGATVWPASNGMEAFIRLFEMAGRLGLPPREGHSQVGDSTSFGAVFEQTGFEDVVIRDITIPTVFRDFEEYWEPVGNRPGAGRTEAYVAALSESDRQRLRTAMRESLPVQPDGSIHLKARALALRARKT